MYVDSIWLDDVPQSKQIKDIRNAFEHEYKERFGMAKGKGLYAEDDWSRIAFCYSLFADDGGSVLDVGVGPGALLNMLGLGGEFSTVTGIDIRHYTKLVKLHDGLDIRIMSVDAMEFADDSFDSVICMEVLEHIDLEQFESALSELRRVARKKLFMTVPIREPEPLPSYHKLRFDFSDIEKYFPHGRYYLMERKRGVPWLGIVEEFE